MHLKEGNPELVTKFDPSKSFQGYTLFAPWGAGMVWLVDMQGRFVHRWKLPYIPGEYGRLLPNGNLLYAGRVLNGPLTHMGGAGGVLLEADWDSNIIWKHEDTYQHHDFCRLDNGNTMYLRWVQVPDDMVGGVKGGVPGTEHDGVMWTDSFREVSRDGEVVWEWLSYEHLDPAVDIVCPLCGRAEWTHGNSCFVMPDGDILTTFRHTDWMVIIDRNTGDIKWRWGAGELAHPHDPTLLENGNILVFDNGHHRRTAHISYSRVVEVNPKTGKIEWEYMDKTRHNFQSSIVSGCQRLPNGNTLICEGHKGRIFEVTRDGETVWEFISPFYYQHPVFGLNNQIFRAYRYAPDYPGLSGRTLDPDKFEWIPEEKGKSAIVRIDRVSDGDKKLADRLSMLGY